jgi:hypothetical protein
LRKPRLDSKCEFCEATLVDVMIWHRVASHFLPGMEKKEIVGLYPPFFRALVLLLALLEGLSIRSSPVPFTSTASLTSVSESVIDSAGELGLIFSVAWNHRRTSKKWVSADPPPSYPRIFATSASCRLPPNQASGLGCTAESG